MAEVLPNNANTAKILKEREEQAQLKAQRDAAVSIQPNRIEPKHEGIKSDRS